MNPPKRGCEADLVFENRLSFSGLLTSMRKGAVPRRDCTMSQVSSSYVCMCDEFNDTLREKDIPLVYVPLYHRKLRLASKTLLTPGFLFYVLFLCSVIDCAVLFANLFATSWRFSQMTGEVQH